MRVLPVASWKYSMIILLAVVGLAVSVRVSDEETDDMKLELEKLEKPCEPPEGGFPSFLRMTPIQAVCYQRTHCGKKWPKTCADHKSSETGATDGFLCDHRGRIIDMAAYRLPYGVSGNLPTDMGPRCEEGYKCKTNTWMCTAKNGSTMNQCKKEFINHARCVKGRCQTEGVRFGDVEYPKKISEIGAQLCRIAMKGKNVSKSITVAVTDSAGKTVTNAAGDAVTKKLQVDVSLDSCTSANVADYKIQLKIPLEAVAFNGCTMDTIKDCLNFRNETVAEKAIKDTINQLGIVETATKGKVCGHGFTNSDTPNNTALVEMMLGRANLVSAQALKAIGDPKFGESDGVAHPVKINHQVGGLVLLLNGCASEPCYQEGDPSRGWNGAPL